MSLLQFPHTIAYFIGSEGGFAKFLNTWLSPTAMPGVFIYNLLSAVLIIFFTYFYTAITFNPVEISNNMKQNGGFIPGIRPGKPTADYINKILTRITLSGAVFLAIITIVPTIVLGATHIPISFGGTTIIIIVGVALETMKQIEAQLLMRHYQGFLK